MQVSKAQQANKEEADKARAAEGLHASALAQVCVCMLTKPSTINPTQIGYTPPPRLIHSYD